MAGEGPDARDSETDPESEPDADAGDASTDGGRTVRVHLPDDLGEWLDDQVADDPNRDRADVLRDLAAAYREIGADADDPARADLLDRLDAQREEYVGLVEDVRERVVDLRRELDDHDHPSEDLGDVPERLDRLESDVAALEERVEAGFENYETVLTELTDAVERTGDRVDTLAAAVVNDRGGDREGRTSEDGDLARLKRAANQAGVRTATCEDCGASLDVGLLTAARCPHCDSRFVDLADDGGLLGSPTLAVADTPALEGATADPGGENE